MGEHGWRAWGEMAKPVGEVVLDCADGSHTKVLRNLSGGTRIDDTLFVAADEFAGIERFTLAADNCSKHVTYDLHDLLPLRDPGGEADLEGLAPDQGWLWVVGSHARTRRKPEKEEGERIRLDRLADLRDTRPRCLIARLPLVRGEDGWRPVAQDGDRCASMLKQTKHGNALMKALKHNPLLGPFTRIPAKEGGFDIEGIAACGNRIALGLRGPVITTHAVLLEIEVEEKEPGRLKMCAEPCKRLLAMEGLGIRDLKRKGDDLLILAGPTTGLSGPVALYRWRDWANDPPQDSNEVRLHRPERILELPFGRGRDHPEGLALWGENQILLIYDSPSEARVDDNAATIKADIFDLPD